jgi:dTDP-glucose 4,6-dehydratase
MAPDLFDHRSVYGEGKRLAELLCLLYARQHGLQPRIARCFAFVGPYLPLDVHFAVGDFIRDALQGGPIRVNGDGTPCRSYLYAADLALWLWTLLVRGIPCRPYNVGSDQTLSIAQVAHTVATSTAQGCAVRIERQATSGRPAERYVPSLVRARRDCGLTVRIPFEEAVQRTLSWYRRRLETLDRQPAHRHALHRSRWNSSD